MKKYRDKNGDLHRQDGPAVIWDNGTKFWSINGKWHRKNGPAVEWEDGRNFWYWEGLWVMNTKGLVTESQLKEFKLRILN